MRSGKKRKRKHGARLSKTKPSLTKSELLTHVAFIFGAAILVAFLVSTGEIFTSDQAGEAHSFLVEGEEQLEDVSVSVAANKPQVVVLNLDSKALSVIMGLSGGGHDASLSLGNKYLINSKGVLSGNTYKITTFEESSTSYVGTTPTTVTLEIPSGAQVTTAHFDMSVEQTEQETEDPVEEPGTSEPEKSEDDDAEEKPSDEPEEVDPETGIIDEDEPVQTQESSDNTITGNVVSDQEPDTSVFLNDEVVFEGEIDFLQYIDTSCDESLCQVELEFTSDVKQIVQLENLLIEYTLPAKDITQEVQEFCPDYPCEVPLVLLSTEDARITLSDIVIATLEENETQVNETSEPDPVPKSCEDSDETDDLFIKGTVTQDDEEAHHDTCDGSQLTQWSCEETLAESSSVQCPSGCEDGACVVQLEQYPSFLADENVFDAHIVVGEDATEADLRAQQAVIDGLRSNGIVADDILKRTVSEIDNTAKGYILIGRQSSYAGENANTLLDKYDLSDVSSGKGLIKLVKDDEKWVVILTARTEEDVALAANVLANWKENSDLLTSQQTVFDVTSSECVVDSDCPKFNSCVSGTCENFCEGETSLSDSTEQVQQSANQQETVASALKKLGYEFDEDVNLDDFELTVSSRELIISSQEFLHSIDTSITEFFLTDSSGKPVSFSRNGEQDIDVSSIRQNEKVKVITDLYIVELEDQPTIAILDQSDDLHSASVRSRVEAYKERLRDSRKQTIDEMQKLEFDTKKNIHHTYDTVFNGMAIQASPDEIDEIRRLPGVKRIYQDAQVHVNLMDSVRQINVPQVWEEKDQNDRSLTGHGVKIAIIDTGVDYTHKDLGGCTTDEFKNGNCAKVKGGFDFVNNDDDPMDDRGHGTHVAATAAGNGDLKGVAPDADIYAYKVLGNDGGGTVSDIIQAIEQSVDPNQDGDFSDKMDIISLSLGARCGGSYTDDCGPDDPMSKAIDYVVENGVVAVISAGNGGSSMMTVGSPGTARKAITVAASTKCNDITWFSSRGPVPIASEILLKPDISAPGNLICAAQYGTYQESSECLTGNHVAISGTSMAAPHVSGAAALLIQAHPDWSPGTLKAALMGASLDIQKNVVTQGAGHLDPEASLSTPIVMDPPSLAFEFTTPSPQKQVPFTIKNIDSSDITAHIRVKELTDMDGNQHNYASLDKSVVEIAAGETAEIILDVDLENSQESRFSGKVAVEVNEKEYLLPFYFERVSKLNVKFDDPSFSSYGKLIYQNEEDIYDWGISYFQSETTFRIDPGKYVVYAVSPSYQKENLMLKKRVEVQPSEKEVVEFSDEDIEEAKKFTIKAKTIDQRPLEHSFIHRFDVLSDGKTFSSFTVTSGTEGDRIVHVSKKPDNKLDYNIIFGYNGIPAGGGLTTEEQYMLGWFEKNIENTLPETIEFKDGDYFVYDMQRHLPGYISDNSRAHWMLVPPVLSSSSIWFRFGYGTNHLTPLSRKIYTMSSEVSDDYRSNWELDVSVSQTYPDAPNAFDIREEADSIELTGYEKNSFTLGKIPYQLPSLQVTGDQVTLNRNLLVGNQGNTEVYASIYFKDHFPKITIKYNDKEFSESLTGRFNIYDTENFYYQIPEDGTYTVDIDYKTNLLLWHNINISSTFTYPSEDANPPELVHIDAPPVLIQQEPYMYTVQVEFTDENDITQRRIATREAGTDEWGDLDVEVDDQNPGIFKATMPTSEIKVGIDLLVEAQDSFGNEVTYIISHSAHKADDIDSFNLETENAEVSPGGSIQVDGLCVVNENQNCKSFYLNYYINGEYHSSDRTLGIFSEPEGPFEFSYNVPTDYSKDSLNVTVSFPGTGIYPPKNETISIGVTEAEYDVMVSDLVVEVDDGREGEIYTSERPKVTVSNVGKKDVSNVNVSLFVSNVLRETVQIPLIEVDQQIEVAFDWTPTVASALYLLTAQVEAEQDQNTQNNEVSIVYKPSTKQGPDLNVYSPRQDPKTVGRQTQFTMSVYNYGTEEANDVVGSNTVLFDPQQKFVPYSKKVDDIDELTSIEFMYHGNMYNITAQNEGETKVVSIEGSDLKQTLTINERNQVNILHNGMGLFFDEESEQGATVLLGNATFEEFEIGSIRKRESKFVSFDWHPIKKGRYVSIFQADTEDELDYENNYEFRTVRVVEEGKDLAVTMLRDKDSIDVINVKKEVPIIVENVGEFDATKVKVSLFELYWSEDDYDESTTQSLVGEVLLDEIKVSDGPKEVVIDWTPKKVAEYELTAVVETKGEVAPDNNVDDIYGYVNGKGPDVTTRLSVYGSSTIEAWVRNLGNETAEEVLVTLYEETDNGLVHIDNKTIYDLDPWDQDSQYVDFDWGNGDPGEFVIVAVAQTENDSNENNNEDRAVFHRLSEGHDLSVNNLRYGNLIVKNKSNFMYVSVRNLGQSDSDDYVLQVKANDKVIYSGFHKYLQGGRYDYVDFSWTPRSAGIYTLDATITHEDENQENNIMQDTVTVFDTRDVSLEFSYFEDDFNEREVYLGTKSVVRDSAIFSVPDTKISGYISRSRNDYEADLYYVNLTIEDENHLGTTYLAKKTNQDGLVLYEVYANNMSGTFDEQHGAIGLYLGDSEVRFSELDPVVCKDYSFEEGTCDEWIDTDTERYIYKGSLNVYFYYLAGVEAIALADQDYDHDGSPDWDDTDSDNDGIDDTEDNFVCLNGRVKSRQTYNITLNETKSEKKNPFKNEKIDLKTNANKKLAEFNYDFSKKAFDCREVIIDKQADDVQRGYTILSGFELEEGETKTVYVDKILNPDEVCIKDAEVTSLNEVDTHCEGENEVLVTCDGTNQHGYTCTLQGTQYKITGLNHSAVYEPGCQESWSCGSWGSCSSGKQTRTCTDANACGTTISKPAEEQFCTSGSSGSSSGSSGSRGGSGSSGSNGRGNLFDLKDITKWKDGDSRELKLDVGDEIRFKFLKNTYEVEVRGVKTTNLDIYTNFLKKVHQIALGKTNRFDVDSDGDFDISISFDKRRFSEATVTFTKLAQDTDTGSDGKPKQPQFQEVTPIDSDQPRSLGVPENPEYVIDEDASKKSSSSFLVYTLILITALVILGASVFARHTIIVTNHEREKTLLRYDSSLDELQHYVLKQKRKNVADTSIKKALIDRGWPKPVVKEVYKRIKNNQKL